MSKHEDANLILKLYDLRREPVMREARNWFMTFNPTNVQDFIDVLISDKSAYYRMVASYWEMAASLVNHGAIDEEMFNDANGEHIFFFAKIEPFLPELRAKFNMPQAYEHLETLVRRLPNADERIASLRERMKEFAMIREQQAKRAQAAGGD